MDSSDDDDVVFSPSQQSPSPSPQLRKLKRLKRKSINTSPTKSIDHLLSLPKVDFAELEALEASETSLDTEFINEPLLEGLDDENELNCNFDELGFGEKRKETKRVLDFDEVDENEVDYEGFKGEIRGFELEKTEKKRPSEEDLSVKKEKKRTSEEDLNVKKEKKKKKEKGVNIDDGDVRKPKTTASSNKRREEKERKDYLQQLHAESQRFLRETRDASFKPIPVVQKPISSILEKIRQRKLEVSKKTLMLNNNYSFSEDNVSVREVNMYVESENVHIELKGVESVDKVANMVQDETVAYQDGVECSLYTPLADGSKESPTQSIHENVPSHTVLNEESTPAFRAPVDDTQDLFGDSQKSDSTDEPPDDQQNSHLEEVLAPSLLTMNLKFDSAPPDELSSDEEDNDKENIDPNPYRLDNEYSSVKDDPVKAFVDDEAEEEDDSDNDLHRFKESDDDEDVEDSEELNDMIATGYEERLIDNERRNELHQKWLEQQDAAGTDNLLQRLNCDLKHRDTALLEEEEVEDDNDEEVIDEAVENLASTDLARINSRKAKQMIIQMFADKNDSYLSDDEEEPQRKLVKQHLLVRAEEQATLVPPAEDENSRQVFGLIKKLNTGPDTKKRPKSSSFFDTVLRGGNSNSSSKSSFLGRASNHTLPSSKKQGSSMVRSYIFGRDDSNSRSSISMSEDSSDMTHTSKETRPTRNVTSKFSYSQAKSNNQIQNASAETASRTSLFEILKQSSIQSSVCNQDSSARLTETVFAAFKIPKKPIKIEGKS